MRRIALLLSITACGDDGASLFPDASPDAPIVDTPVIPASCVGERSMTDRPDDSSLDQIHVLYVMPQDGVDRARDTNGQICNSVRAFATWFHATSGSYLRFDSADGAIDIGFVRLPQSDSVMRGNDPNNESIATGTAFVRERIENELDAMGVVKRNKLYAVYYEGSSVYACGGGAYPPVIIDRVGAMYLQGMPPGVSQPCGEGRPWGQASLVPNYIDYGMLHELVHSTGLVAMEAPHQHAFGHVFDSSRDLMYSPRGTSDPGWAVDDPNGLLLDINSDDYAETLSKLSLLSPLPAGAQRPPGW
jgi:hypothetical protein